MPTIGQGLAVLARPVTAYRRLFDRPGPAAFVLAGLLSRLTTSMVGLGLILSLSSGTHEYVLAGAIVAVLILANAAANPVVGRLVDRHGQDRVLMPLALAFGVTMGTIIVAIHWDAPPWVLFPLSVLVGATMPVVAPLIRARWTTLYADADRLHTAYSFEGATTEFVYVVGPMLVAALATGINPVVGLLAVLACAVIGTVALAVQRGTQPPPQPVTADNAGYNVMSVPALRVLCLSVFGVGAVFGSIEIVTVAYASHLHSRSLSGVLIGVWGIGSVIAGLVYGAIKVHGPAHRRLQVAVTLFVASLVPLCFVGGVLSLTGLLLLSGLTIAPSMIASSEAVQRVVPPAALTEAFLWILAMTALGMTVGNLAGGWGIAHLDIRRIYVVPLCFAVLALLALLVGARTLRAAVLTPEVSVPA